MVWLDFYANVAIAAKDVQATESLAGVSLMALSRKKSSSHAPVGRCANANFGCLVNSSNGGRACFDAPLFQVPHASTLTDSHVITTICAALVSRDSEYRAKIYFKAVT